MATLEIRRHAERGAGAVLSPAGVRAAEALARGAPRYAVVTSSPLPRAMETARLVGGRLDGTEPALLPDLAQLVQLRTIEEHASLLGEARERELAREQAAAWARIAGAAGRGHALAIGHGGAIELGALVVARALGTALSGPALSFLDGFRVRYESDRPVAIEVVRAPR
ncbi:MAG TPA: histidine phosphatase family protein [Candidatus Limnocylindria bacterium]|nr:histidine phosphatase family protein [Candidatus Limnocylindria bacterium]